VALEIERKFLVTGEAWRAAVTRSGRLSQGYLAGSATASVRVRTSADRAWLNIKAAVLGVMRDEYEYEIPLADGRAMLERLASGARVDKTRHRVSHDGNEWEIDEFDGANRGLVVAEIELDRVDQPFARPDWLGAEVTDLARYYNINLVAHPFCDWTEDERAP
jgi:adenylate cyclase